MTQIDVPAEVENDPDRRNDPVARYAESILKRPYRLRQDEVASWYFRLNGFLTTTNFIVHLPKGGGQGTDADVFGIRFPERDELGLKDDMRFKDVKKPMLAIVEVTTGSCKVNGPWSEREKENIQYVLKAIGLFEQSQVQKIADNLYDDCRYENENANAIVQMFAVGKSISNDWSSRRPLLVQLTFSEILGFIYDRFEEGRHAKASNKQWDQTGRVLWRQSEGNTKEGFVEKALKLLCP